MIIKPPAPMQPSERAYDANAWRSAQRSTLAYSERDIWRCMARALSDGQPASVLLARDITLSKPIVVPSTSRGLDIDGGGFTIYAARESSALYMFEVHAGFSRTTIGLSLRNLQLSPHPETERVSTFLPSQTSVIAIGVDEARVSLLNVSLQSNEKFATFDRVLCTSDGDYHEVRARMVGLWARDNNGTPFCTSLLDDYVSLMESSIDTHGVAMGGIGENGYANTFTDTSYGANTQAIDSGVAVYPSAPTMFVTVSGTASGTFTLDNSFDDYRPPASILRLVCTSKGAGSCSLADTTHTKLTAAWTPNTVGDNLSLMWIGTYWTEIGRSDV